MVPVILVVRKCILPCISGSKKDKQQDDDEEHTAPQVVKVDENKS
jgi:hypothetical protein